VNRHILLNGMDSSYTRWIHHGERLDVDVIEYPDDVHDNDDDFIHKEEGVIEDYSVDKLEAVLGDLQNAADRQDMTVKMRVDKIRMVMQNLIIESFLKLS
jgi:hypothetical protein